MKEGRDEGDAKAGPGQLSRLVGECDSHAERSPEGGMLFRLVRGPADPLSFI
jgi:hypothetical protein